MSETLKVDDPDFREGVRLFNGRRFFEAHEAWEALWRRTCAPGPEREIYQGLIQLAAACHHLLRNNVTGAQGCLKNARGHLDPYLQETEAIDLPGLIGKIESAVVQKKPETLPRIPA